jgi:DNA polymerase-1
MKEGLHACPDCPFRGPRVGPKGNPNSPLVIIGESPGQQELVGGIPFIGPSGKILDKALAQTPEIGEPYIINALQCWPGRRDDKDPAKLAAATQACRHHVLAEIGRAPRKAILALGNPGLWSATENYDLKITQERGKLLPTPLADVGVVPSAHPAFLMSGGKGCTFQQFMRDVKYAADLALGGCPKKPPDVKYVVAKTWRDIESWSRLFRYFDVIGADIETSALDPLDGRILCAGFAGQPGYVYVVPEHLLKHLDMLFDNNARFVWQNGKFDLRFLTHFGFNARLDEDTLLMSYALDEMGGIHDLETLASDWLNSPNWKQVLTQYLPTKDSSYELVPRDILHHYMALDIGNTRALYDVLRPRVAADKHLERLYTRTLIPASRMLKEVELNGIYVDMERVQANETWYKQQCDELAQELVEMTKQFPESGYTDKLPNSPKQLQRLFYDDLRFPLYKGKRSTDAKTLEHLPAHPIIVKLRKYRKFAKERGTYITPLLGRAKEKGKKARPSIIAPSGRVHATYLIHGTRTGRLASRDPNMQNVPRNPQIRGQYVAAPGYRLVEVDLNQAELRILAHLSRDVELCRIYNTAGMSLHDEVRAEIWGYPKDWSEEILEHYLDKFRLTHETRFDEKGADLLLAEQKMRAKNVNFGVVYGISASGLSEQTDSPPQDCQDWIDKWFGRFKGAAKFIQACKAAPRNGQTLITPFGRKKRFGVVSPELIHNMENEAANFPEQSSASDCTLQAGINLIGPMGEKYGAKLINLIHDALLWEVPDDDAVVVNVAKEVKTEMEAVPKRWGFTLVPFIAEAKHGMRWGSLSGLKL